MSTFIVGTLVFGLFAGVGYRGWCKKKKGEFACSGCRGCANAQYCHREHSIVDR